MTRVLTVATALLLVVLLAVVVVAPTPPGLLRAVLLNRAATDPAPVPDGAIVPLTLVSVA